MERRRMAQFHETLITGAMHAHERNLQVGIFLVASHAHADHSIGFRCHGVGKGQLDNVLDTRRLASLGEHLKPFEAIGQMRHGAKDRLDAHDGAGVRFGARPIKG
eukprot:scaffold8681_cov200-Amphora_coffeaeformis.AAC.1